jgi:carbamoyltransferase
MTAIVGISAFYHDSAACLVVDGHIVAAAQEERFTRRKHDADFPAHALQYCLAAGGLGVRDVDYVVYYEKPLLKFDRLMETYMSFAPRGIASFGQATQEWLHGKGNVPRMLRRALGPEFRGNLVFTTHHEAHAASAFLPSPFDEAAILTIDGVGEWGTTTIGVGRGRAITPLTEIRFPHSLGLLYAAFTTYCGFKVNSGEYKLMGLAPYGRPRFRDQIHRTLIDLKPDGSFWLDMQYFNYCQGLTMTSPAFHDTFGGPPRAPESPLDQRHMDLACSVQAVTEEVMLALAREAHSRTGLSHLVMAGGVALNCVGNGRLLREGPFRDIWVQPASGDAGGALGAALFTWHQLLEHPRVVSGTDQQHGSLLGPEFTEAEIREVLDQAGTVYEVVPDTDALLARVVDRLSAGDVIGWFQGRMEFGPRALGARSILGDARVPDMQAVMNSRIKFRESFRPFAPMVLREEAHRWFEWATHHESPYMLMTAPVRGATIPAVTHVDGSARLQTVDQERHPLVWRLLRTFFERTGCPVLINTSFNVRGEPIVCTPDDALQCFLATDMDVLVMDHVIVRKSAQPAGARIDRTRHLAQFDGD